jgi:hypothetical protein
MTFKFIMLLRVTRHTSAGEDTSISTKTSRIIKPAMLAAPTDRDCHSTAAANQLNKEQFASARMLLKASEP